MGTEYLLVVRACDAPLLDGADAVIDDLERRWSRFLDDSEISVLNRNPGVPVILRPDTFQVIRAAVDAAIATGGRFDPTVHDSMVALGYSRDFGDMTPVGDGPQPLAAPGVAGIELDGALFAVTLPPGVKLDLGGIGKGTAADIVSAWIMDRGAHGVAVSLGGDIRVRGDSPSGGGWSFHDDAGDLDLPTLRDGGVCTSSTSRRRWTTDQGEVHHLLDPSTGVPVEGDIESITVVGASAQQAEVLTKAALVCGDGASDFLASCGSPHVVRRRAA